MAKIELVFRPIIGWSGSIPATDGDTTGKVFHHEFILVTNDDGTRYVASGWPAPTEVPGELVLTTKYGDYDEASEDFPKKTAIIDGKETLVLDQETFDSYTKIPIVSGSEGSIRDAWDRITAHMEAIDDQKLPYLPTSQNSNSAASQALRRSGFDAPDAEWTNGLDPFSGIPWAPATENPLTGGAYNTVYETDETGRPTKLTTETRDIDGIVRKSIIETTYTVDGKLIHTTKFNPDGSTAYESNYDSISKRLTKTTFSADGSIVDISTDGQLETTLKLDNQDRLLSSENWGANGSYNSTKFDPATGEQIESFARLSDGSTHAERLDLETGRWIQERVMLDGSKNVTVVTHDRSKIVSSTLFDRNGSLVSENIYDEQGLLTDQTYVSPTGGLTRTHFEGGVLKWSEYWVHDKLSSKTVIDLDTRITTQYWETGLIKSKAVSTLSFQMISDTQYGENGSKISESKYSSGFLTETIRYFDNGDRSETHFANGRISKVVFIDASEQTTTTSSYGIDSNLSSTVVTGFDGKTAEVTIYRPGGDSETRTYYPGVETLKSITSVEAYRISHRIEFNVAGEKTKEFFFHTDGTEKDSYFFSESGEALIREVHLAGTVKTEIFYDSLKQLTVTETHDNSTGTVGHSRNYGTHIVTATNNREDSLDLNEIRVLLTHDAMYFDQSDGSRDGNIFVQGGSFLADTWMPVGTPDIEAFIESRAEEYIAPMQASQPDADFGIMKAQYASSLERAIEDQILSRLWTQYTSYNWGIA